MSTEDFKSQETNCITLVAMKPLTISDASTARLSRCLLTPEVFDMRTSNRVLDALGETSDAPAPLHDITMQSTLETSSGLGPESLGVVTVVLHVLAMGHARPLAAAAGAREAALQTRRWGLPASLRRWRNASHHEKPFLCSHFEASFAGMALEPSRHCWQS